MTIHHRDCHLPAVVAAGGYGIQCVNARLVDLQIIRGDLALDHVGLKKVGIHFEHVVRGALDDALGVNEERTANIDDGRHARHGDVFGLAQASVQERRGKYGVGHGVGFVEVVVVALANLVDLVCSAAGEAGMMPAAQIPLVESDLDAVTETSLVEQVDCLGDLLLGGLAVRDAMRGNPRDAFRAARADPNSRGWKCSRDIFPQH